MGFGIFSCCLRKILVQSSRLSLNVIRFWCSNLSFILFFFLYILCIFTFILRFFLSSFFFKFHFSCFSIVYFDRLHSTSKISIFFLIYFIYHIFIFFISVFVKISLSGNRYLFFSFIFILSTLLIFH